MASSQRQRGQIDDARGSLRPGVTAGDGGAAALSNHFIKIGHLTVKPVPDIRDDYRAISSAPINHVFLKYQSQRGHVPIGVQHDQTFHRWPAVL
jgi:hypothetical protein